MVVFVQVALANSGTIYVSDGYCNSRVLEYAPDGTFLGTFDLPEAVTATLPHSVVIDECHGLLYVAAREPGLVHVFQLGTREPQGVCLPATLMPPSCASARRLPATLAGGS